jgi:hypothetical protein
MAISVFLEIAHQAHTEGGKIAIFEKMPFLHTFGRLRVTHAILEINE